MLDCLDIVSDEATGLKYWKAEFCIFDDYDMVLVIGSAVYITQLFVNPRLMLVNCLR